MGATILLVDDEAELRYAIAVRLKAAGFTVETASNGREALAMVGRVRPDAIVADLLMPEMDGHELVCRLKAQAETARIPVVVLTALPEPARMKWAEDLAHTRVMTKPFDSAALVAAIRGLMAHAAKDEEGR